MQPKNMAIFSGPHEVVYDLYEAAEGLFLPNAFIVSKDKQGLLAHIQQRAMMNTVGSFGLELDTVREQLFGIVEELQPKALEQRFTPSRRKPQPLEVLTENEDIRKAITTFVHRRLAVFLSLVARHKLPMTWKVERRVLVKDFVVEISDETLVPHLYFQRTDKEEVRYRMMLSDSKETWAIHSREVIPITNHPAWLLVDNHLYELAYINGNMVKPFQNKGELRIPKASVKSYFQKFIVKVASKLDIEAEGFDVLSYEELKSCRLEAVKNLFDDRWVFSVMMVYSKASFPWNDKKPLRTLLEFEGDEVRIIKVNRNFAKESHFLQKLQAFGLDNSHGSFFQLTDGTVEPLSHLEWLIHNRLKLEEAGFEVAPLQVEERPVYLFPGRLQLESDQQNDWFDLYGKIQVGEYVIPFAALIKNIREGNRFYRLPNGTHFLIPLEWMAKYRELAQFAKKKGDHLQLNKNQFTLLKDLGVEHQTHLEENLDLVDFHPPVQLNAQLRPYQMEGVKWLVQLYRNKLGACLADDMGLGKTLQTIAALLYAKEQRKNGPEKENLPAGPQLALFQTPADQEFLQPLQALIILPASLVFNWESEIAKFAPHLTVYKHVGPKRYKDKRLIARFDVILTTYQTALRDVDFLEELEYEYIVLDESQQIKNRESKIFKSLNRLEGRHKISLSGTPIENSLSDLWAQMQFINPDLLGAFAFFKREFITPIEKYQDEAKKARLRKMVAPYLLRRTKDEVAGDLPPLSTKVFYSEMTPEQRRMYEKEKSAARNFLLDHFQADNPQYRLLVLKTLTKLRQLVNHPKLVNSQYEKESGKFIDVLEQWEVIRKSGHKVLLFSSFVQYLEMFRNVFNDRGQSFAWLSGQLTPRERQTQVMRFEQHPDVQAFLISIKSGGTGLNLTAADYVFVLDPWWNPSTEQQAIARAHRIGQEKNVFAIKFITRDSIEEKILGLQDRKSKLAEDIIERVRKSELTKGDIEYLLD